MADMEDRSWHLWYERLALRATARALSSAFGYRPEHDSTDITLARGTRTYAQYQDTLDKQLPYNARRTQVRHQPTAQGCSRHDMGPFNVDTRTLGCISRT